MFENTNEPTFVGSAALVKSRPSTMLSRSSRDSNLLPKLAVIRYCTIELDHNIYYNWRVVLGLILGRIEWRLGGGGEDWKTV